MDITTEPRVLSTMTSDPEAGAGIAPERADPHAALERAMIDQFLADRGYTLHSVNTLPPADRQSLLRAAAAFATLKLAEIEARAQFVDEID